MKLANLNHSGMIVSVISWPWSTILQHPPLFWFFLRLCNKYINSHLEFFILSLHNCNGKCLKASHRKIEQQQYEKIIKKKKHLCRIYLHSSAVLYKCWKYLVFQVINFLRKIRLRSSWLNVILFTKRNPYSCKLRSL